MKVLILNHDEIVDLLPMRECIKVMRETFAKLADAEVYQPLRTILRPPSISGIMGLMPAYIYGDTPAFGVKTICIFPENTAKGKDSHQGAVMLFEAQTGELKALFNASAITAIRTAAVSGVATDLLARKDAGNLAIIGTGVQARSHLEAMSAVRRINRCRVVSRQISNAQSFAEEMSNGQYSFLVEAVENIETALEEADIVVTVTTAREAIVKQEWLSPGAHLNVVGSSTPKNREVDGRTMAAASLFVDSRDSTINEAGDYLLALEEGAIAPGHIRAEIGELIKGTKEGRLFEQEITLFKSLGLAVEDVAAAEYLYKKACEYGAGTWAEF